MLGALAGAFAVCVTIVGVTGAPESIVSVATVIAGYGALLATALAWTAGAGDGDRNVAAPRHDVEWNAGVVTRDRKRNVGVPLLLLAAGAAGAAVHDAGAIAYLALPIWFWRAASQGRLAGLGLGMPVSRVALCAGATLGVALGTHLLIVASMTSGYRPQAMNGAVVAAILYDIGVQVLVTEAFFRGALFNRVERRWSFAAATALSTLGSVLRYLVDPRLPGTAEIVTGMIFYVTLLSVANCWLFWRFGNPLPGIVNALVFFTAYRFIGEP